MSVTDEEEADFRAVLDRRATIGVAVGILMERYGMGRDASFTYLKRRSSYTNRKVYDLAEELIISGQLADPDRDGASERVQQLRTRLGPRAGGESLATKPPGNPGLTG